MGDYFPCITDAQADLIRNAKVFFVATADPDMTEGPDGQGAINLSPKGGVPIHILDPNRVAYLDYKGSGNETVRHSHGGSPITLMVCSFDADDAAIVRLYGRAASTPAGRLSCRGPAAGMSSRGPSLQTQAGGGNSRRKNIHELRLRCSGDGLRPRPGCCQKRPPLQRGPRRLGSP